MILSLQDHIDSDGVCKQSFVEQHQFGCTAIHYMDAMCGLCSDMYVLESAQQILSACDIILRRQYARYEHIAKGKQVATSKLRNATNENSFIRRFFHCLCSSHR